MSIFATPYFWLGIIGTGSLFVGVTYAFSIESFGQVAGSSVTMDEDSSKESWEENLKNIEKELDAESSPSPSLQTLKIKMNSIESNNDEEKFQILKNWCLSRYKDTYSSMFQKPKEKELEEIKDFCS